jgi:membrane protein implicated in regulation of membrane protease activity
MKSAIYYWIAAVVIFAIVEGATVSLVSVWFIGGSLAALLAAALGASVGLQLGIFVAVSAILLALLRPFVKKYAVPHRTRTNADRLIGRQALVTEQIENLKETGAIKINGVLWTAKSTDNSVIPVGAAVTITRLEGAKVYVEPVEAAVAGQKEN